MAQKKEDTPPAKAPTEIKADPELVKAKIAAGLRPEQAQAVALDQARHDAAAE